MTKTMISARVDEKLNEGLKKLAISSRRSKAFVIVEALEKHLAQEAWINEQAKEAFRKADEAGEWISNETMMKWLRSLGTANELPPPKPDIFKKQA